MSRFDLLYQGAVEKRKRMEKLIEFQKLQGDPNLTFFPVTNSNRQSAGVKTRTVTRTKTQPGPPCSVDLILKTILGVVSSGEKDLFTEYTKTLNKILASLEIQVPVTVKTSSKVPRADPKRFQSLYEDSIQRRKAQKERQEAEKKRKLFSFAPKINKVSSQTVEESGKDGRFASLYNDAELRRKKMEKSMIEQAKKRKTHSFTPKINKQPKGTNKKKGSRFERLYADGSKKRAERAVEIRERREEIKRLQEEEQRIVPSNNEKSRRKRMERQRPESSLPNEREKDAHKSNGSSSKKATKISKVRQKSIDAKRNKIQSKKKKSKPPNLPGHYSKDAVAKYRARLEFYRQSLECTFSPKINKKRGVEQKLEKSVFDRLQNESRAKHERIKKREEQRPYHCSFTPSINPGPNNRDGTVFSRLNEQSKKKIERYKNRIVELDPECTFSPKINSGINQQTPKRPSKPSNSSKKKPQQNGRILSSNICPVEKRESSTHMKHVDVLEHSNERLQHPEGHSTDTIKNNGGEKEPTGVQASSSKIGSLKLRQSSTHMKHVEVLEHSNERLQHIPPS
jgi:hypothetical protein